jgi:pyruvate dehydrogenase E2 component (dihydrolipoamide acetyltransferase)
METGSIAAWNLKEGDSFGAGDSFCSIETDKATMDFEAQDDGILAKILVQAGPGELKLGDPIMVTVYDAADVAAFTNFSPAAASSSSPAAVAAAPVEPVVAAPTPVGAPAPPTTAATAATGGRVVASPLAHMLAKELGHDIGAIPGTGPSGRILAADVKEFSVATATTTIDTASTAAPVAVVAAATPIHGAGYTDYPLTEQAKEAAARLAQSKRNVPHYYLTVDVACDELLKLRATLNSTTAVNDESSMSIGVFDLLIKAAALSMKSVPAANASWMDSVVRVYDSVDINVVVGSGDELVTPVLRDCSRMGLTAIRQEMASAVASLGGGGSNAGVGTFTVINLGMYGVKSCAPIIREPQSCALAIGALENRIVPNDNSASEEIYKESVVFTATLSCDHRVVDGAVGAQWLAAFKAHVENPMTLLL